MRPVTRVVGALPSKTPAFDARESADHPVEAPAVGDALQLVLAGVLQDKAGAGGHVSTKPGLSWLVGVVGHRRLGQPGHGGMREGEVSGDRPRDNERGEREQEGEHERRDVGERAQQAASRGGGQRGARWLDDEVLVGGEVAPPSVTPSPIKVIVPVKSSVAVRACPPPSRTYSAASEVGHGTIETKNRNTSVRSMKRLLTWRTALIIPVCSIQTTPTVANETA